jgi:hypothetical protein
MKIHFYRNEIDTVSTELLGTDLPARDGIA